MLHTRLSFFENQPFQTHDPLKTKISDPLPTQPAGQPDPRTTLAWGRICFTMYRVSLTAFVC